MVFACIFMVFTGFEWIRQALVIFWEFVVVFGGVF